MIESKGRVFHMHVNVQTEDGPQELSADIVIEPRRGLLMVSAGGLATAGHWPHPERWGTRTFEEFLCSRTPSWIVGKMLGDDTMIFDSERTHDILVEACGEGFRDAIAEFVQCIDDSGDILEDGEEVAERIQAELDEPLDGWIFMKPTGFATFLIEAVIPKVLSHIAPPPIVTKQTNLKLC